MSSFLRPFLEKSKSIKKSRSRQRRRSSLGIMMDSPSNESLMLEHEDAATIVEPFEDSAASISAAFDMMGIDNNSGRSERSQDSTVKAGNHNRNSMRHHRQRRRASLAQQPKEYRTSRRRMSRRGSGTAAASGLTIPVLTPQDLGYGIDQDQYEFEDVFLSEAPTPNKARQRRASMGY